MKKFTIIIMSFLFVIACTLSGCAGFSINRVKYYNEVLATVGNSTITRFDLLTAYNSYGKSYYVNQLAQEESVALSSTLDLLIEREALYLYAKQDNSNNFSIKDYQVNAIIEDLFENLNSQMNSYLTTAETMLGISPISTADTTTGDDSTKYTQTFYSHYEEDIGLENNQTRAILVIDEANSTADNTVYKIKYTAVQDSTFNPIIDKTLLNSYEKESGNYNQLINAIKEKYLKTFKANVNSKYAADKADLMYNKAISLLNDDLISYEYYLRDENGKAYNKVLEDLLNRYFSRSFDSAIKSQYLTNIQTYFLNTETLSLDKLIEAYNNQLFYDKLVYGNNLDSYKSKLTSIGTEGDTILYHPSTDAQFGYFIHVLISFGDEQEEMNALKEEISNLSKTDEHYQDKIDEYETKLSNLTVVSNNENYNDISVNEFMQKYYQPLLMNKSYDARLKAFVNLMYNYSADPGLLSGGMPYVVGTNGNTSMVEEFTAEAEALMKNEKDGKPYGNKTTNGHATNEIAGNMSVWDGDSYSNLCVSTHGIHLLMYVEDVAAYDSNSITPIISLTDAENKFNLYTKVVNPLTNKTYFDLMFDKVYPADSNTGFSSNNGYTAYENKLVENSKQINTVVKYTTRINNTKTSI